MEWPEGGREHPRRVVIACQGGGSHTAFTAGVLGRLLGANELTGYQIAGLSGTSGGAVCALLAWYALLDNHPAHARQLLEQFWIDNSARAPMDMLVNSWVLWANSWQNLGVAPPTVSPYHSPASVLGAEQFRQMLRRQVEFSRIDVDKDAQHPLLLIGAVDVLSGRFRAFSSRRDRITPDIVLASAAIPNLFQAVRLEDGTYWDGLFSQNPPVRELLDVGPDELWVIQINPQRLEAEPTTLADIADRRNELSGNLSLYQELAFIEKIDQLLDTGQLSPGQKYKQIVVRVIELSRSRLSRGLGAASKLNRDPRFIQNLMSHGVQRAEEFLSALAFERAWLNQDIPAVMELFTEDGAVVSGPAFSQRGSYRGTEELRRFMHEQMPRGVRMDLTRKHVAGEEKVTWTIRRRGDGMRTEPLGYAQAEFRAGKVATLILSPRDRVHQQ